MIPAMAAWAARYSQSASGRNELTGWYSKHLYRLGDNVAYVEYSPSASSLFSFTPIETHLADPSIIR